MTVKRVPVNGYVNLYDISEDGRIWSIRSNKYLKPNKDKDGYLLFHARVKGKRQVFKLHRLVAEHYIPNPKSLPCINHKDGDKTNNTILNLEWCSHSQNMQHAVAHDLAKGLFGSFKLNKAQVKAIKQRLAAGDKQINIAKDYSVTFQMISKIATGKTWKSVQLN